MLEVEVKYPVADIESVARTLAGLGATPGADRTDRDHYFNAPDLDFALTDEAVRLRRIGRANRLTYKGPKLDTISKTRTEIEIRLADGDATAADAERLLLALRYRAVAVVTKRRRLYHLTRGGFDVEVCLDDVDRVGTFAEVEVVAEPARYEDARRVVLDLAAELGLANPERRSYLELLLSRPPG